MIRKLTMLDKTEYVDMVLDFYSTNAVMHPIPKEYIEDTFDMLIKDNTFADCYFLEDKGNVCGYILTSKTWSQEGGGICVWVEELYIKSEFRGGGYGKQLIEYVMNKYGNVRFRLEVESDNTTAVSLYKKCGYDFIPYKEMLKEKC